MKKNDSINCRRCGKDVAVVDRKIATHGPGVNSILCPGSGYDFAAHEQKKKQKQN